MKLEFICNSDDLSEALDIINAAFDVRAVLQERGTDVRRVTLDVRVRTAEITPEIAAHVMHHFGIKGGYAPGSFTRDLVMMIARADLPNRARLALGHPAYVAAVALAQDELEGAARLQAIAAAETTVAR